MHLNLALLLLISLFAVCTVHAEPGLTDQEITIGSTRNLSGKDPRPVSIAEGQKLYIKRINESGGIAGRKIKLIEYDDGYDPQRSIANVKKLLDVDHVFLIFGTYGSANLNAVAPLLNAAAVPAVSVSASMTGVPSNQIKYIYSVKATYTEETQAMVDFLVTEKHWPKIQIFYQDDALGQEGRGGIVKGLHDKNLLPIAMKSYNRQAVNIDASYANAVKAANPDAIVIFGGAQGAIQIANQFALAGIDKPIVASSTLIGADFLARAGELKSEVYFTQGYPLITETKIPLVADYVKAATQSGQAPNDSGFLGYLDAAVLVEAIKATDAPLTRENLAKTFNSKLKNLSVGGIALSFDQDRHSGLHRIFISQLKNKKLIPVK